MLFNVLDIHYRRFNLELCKMDASDLEEIVPLISIHGIPTTVRDTREAYQKQLAVYLILASTLFERIAFYILAATLAITADPEDYSSTRGPIAALIFTGK
jgi:hypothetical protein